MSSIVDVVVIGAGLSGLTAAYTILKEKPSTSLVILEASDRIGGPISTETLKGANGDQAWDIGAARVGSKQKEIQSLIKDLGLETYPHYDSGDKYWILVDGKVKKYSGAIPPLPYLSLADLLRYFNKVDGFQGKVNLDDAKATPKAEEWDNMTVEELKNKVLYTQIAKETVDVMTGLFFGGLKCDQLSVMQYAYEIATCGSWNAHVNGKDTGRMDQRIKGGAGKLVDGLVEHIGRDQIKTGSKVNRLEQQGTAGAVVHTVDGDTYQAKSVIVACLPIDHITYNPPLSVPKLLPSWASGSSFVVTYKKSFWRDAGSCGEVLNTQSVLESLKGKDDHPIPTLFDHSAPDGSPALMGIFGPIQVKDNSVDDRKQMVAKFLVNVFGNEEAKNFLDYKEFNWEPCDKVPSPETFKETKASEVLTNIHKPEGVIHWAGTGTAKAWAHTLNGAVDAGQRSAKEVIVKYLQ